MRNRRLSLVAILALLSIGTVVEVPAQVGEFGIKETPVASAVDDVTLNKLLPPLQGENWSPKQFFEMVSQLTGVNIAVTQSVLQGPKLSPSFHSVPLREVLTWACDNLEADYRTVNSVMAREGTAKADVRISLIKIFPRIEKESEGVLKVEKTLHLYNIEPEAAIRQIQNLSSTHGRIYLSVNKPEILLEDEPDYIMAISRKIKEIDRSADEEVTKVVPVKNRSALDIVKEIEKLLPEQEGMLIPEMAENRIYLRDTVETANRLEQLIQSLDKGGPRPEMKETSRSVKIQNGSAELIAADMLKLMPELDQTLKVNTMNNTITIKGEPERWDVVERMIRGLDNLNATAESEDETSTEAK